MHPVCGREELSKACGQSTGEAEPAAWQAGRSAPLCPPDDWITLGCLGWLCHKAALQLGLPWVPAWHHTAGARCSFPLRWGRRCDSPGAAAGAAQATHGRVLPCPGYGAGCQRRSGHGRILAGAGSTAAVGCWIWSLHTAGVAAAGSEVCARCPGRGDVQAAVPEQPPPAAACFQRDMGCADAM